MNVSTENINECFSRFGYKWDSLFNIVGIRATEFGTNTFNDLISVFYRNNISEPWLFKVYESTTDPGFAKNGKTVPEGTASLRVGNYPRMYSLGFVRGNKSRPCLFQVGKAFYYRVKNGRLYNPETLFEGIIGSHIHGSQPNFDPELVFNFSEGCQVIREWDRFLEFLEICKKYGPKQMDYTLIREIDLFA